MGRRKFFYDVWGDVVNTCASRMESTGVAGRVQVSQETFELLKEDFVLEPRGEGEVKGKGVDLDLVPARAQGRVARVYALARPALISIGFTST